MQENAIYSVISPEGCAAILWRDAGEARKAAAAFKPDAVHCLELGVDRRDRRRSREGGAHGDPDGGRAAARAGHSSLHSRRSTALDPTERRRQRRAKYRVMGVLAVVPEPFLAVFPIIPQAYPRSRLSGLSREEADRCSRVGKERSCVSGDNPQVSLDQYRRKRDPGKTPEPFGGRRQHGDRPRFVVQRHDARRLHYDFRLERERRARAAGRSRRACRSSRASGISPCTSRITRSTTRTSRARSRRGSTAPARSRSGTAARTSSLEEKRDGGLTVRLHGERLEGVWTLVPAHLDGDPKNWLLLRKDDDDGAAGASRTSRCSRPPRTRSRPARAGCTSRSGTASARS